MISIYKYPIELDTETDKMCVKIPVNAKPFSVVLADASTAFVYCIVDTEEKDIVSKEVLWLGTGWGLNQEIVDKIKCYKFLGTCEVEDLKNKLIWHFWIEPNYPNIIKNQIHLK